MAAPKKPGSTTTKRGRTPAKPTTIDLEVKDVSNSSGKTSDDKPSGTRFGREGAGESRSSGVPKTARSSAASTSRQTAKSSTTASKSATTASNKPSTSKASSAEKPVTSPTSKPATTDTPTSNKSNPSGSASKPVAVEPKKSGGFAGLGSALAGAVIAVVGLGLVGQMEGASRLPLIGSLYGSGSENAANQEAMDRLNARVEELAASNNRSTASGAGEITRLEAKITELEEALRSQGAANDGTSNTRIAELESEIEGLSTVVTGLSETVSGDAIAQDGGSEAALAAVNAKLTDLGQEVAAISQPDLAPIRSAIETIEADLAALQESISKNAGEIGSVTELAGKLDQQISEIKVSSEVAKTVALNGLGSALQNDRPLFVSISSLEALSGTSEETRRLAELDRQGIPSRETLVSELGLIEEAVQNPSLEAPDASITDKLWANARSLITVRSRGPRDGDSTAAILSRVQAHIENDELQAAQNEWKTLPPEFTNQYQGWREQLDRRQEAFALYEKLSATTPPSNG